MEQVQVEDSGLSLVLKDPVPLAPRSEGKLGWRYNFFMPGRARVVRHCVVFGTANTPEGRQAVFGFIHVNQMVRGQRPWKGAYVK